jgi:LPXTG-site transpeptidase (sortase) family protein
LVPNGAISNGVVPTSRKVGETFTFTILVKNIGNGPTRNNVVANTFDTYLDLLTLTTTQGTLSKGTRSFSITLGDVNPGMIVTIVATVRVNSTLARTETATNTAWLTYTDALNNSVVKNAGAVYTVQYQTLPGTGDLPLNWRESSIKPAAMVPGALLMLMGVTLLILVVTWQKARSHQNRLWMTVGGALLFLFGFMLAITSSGVLSSNRLVLVSSHTPTSNGSIAQGQVPLATSTIPPYQPASAFSTPDSVVPIVTLPNYPVPTPVITITPQPGEIGPDISNITRIVIPILNLDTVVKYVPYDGFTWLITGLQQEVAWMGNTSWPGLGSNTGLAGHVTVAGMGDGPFRHLDELPVGELVLIYTEQNIYTYKVRESIVTDDGDMSVTLPSENPQISMITCMDWDQDTRTYLHRLVVVADLLQTAPLAIGMLP